MKGARPGRGLNAGMGVIRDNEMLHHKFVIAPTSYSVLVSVTGSSEASTLAMASLASPCIASLSTDSSTPTAHEPTERTTSFGDFTFRLTVSPISSPKALTSSIGSLTT